MALAKLSHQLDLLAQLYNQIEIPGAVYSEVVTQGLARGAPDARIVQVFQERHGWPVITVPTKLLADFRPDAALDAGETEVLALAAEDQESLVLIDDELARHEARRLKLEVKGTLGVLVQAVRHQILALEDAELLIQQITARPDIWIGARLCEGVLEGLKKV